MIILSIKLSWFAHDCIMASLQLKLLTSQIIIRSIKSSVKTPDAKIIVVVISHDPYDDYTK